MKDPTKKDIAKSVYESCAKAFGVTVAEMLAGKSYPARAARAMLWQSNRESGWSFEHIARAFGEATPTVFRAVQTHYPEKYPGRGGPVKAKPRKAAKPAKKAKRKVA